MSEQLERLKQSAIDYEMIGLVLRCVFFNKIRLVTTLRADLYRESLRMLREIIGADMQRINTAVFDTLKDVEEPQEPYEPMNIFKLAAEATRESI